MDDMVITSKDTGNLWVEEDKWEFKIKDSSALRKLEGGFGDGNNEIGRLKHYFYIGRITLRKL